jgi:hypothetical protein
MQPPQLVLAVSDRLVSVLVRRLFESGAEAAELFHFGATRLSLTLTRPASIAALPNSGSARLRIDLPGVAPFARRGGFRVGALPLRLHGVLLVRIENQRCKVAVQALRLGIGDRHERGPTRRGASSVRRCVRYWSQRGLGVLAKITPLAERMLNASFSDGWQLPHTKLLAIAPDGPVLSSIAGYLVASAVLADADPQPAELPADAFDAPATLMIDGSALQRLVTPILAEQLARHTPLLVEASVSLPIMPLAPAIAVLGTILPGADLFQQAVQQLVPSLWYRATISAEQPALSVRPAQGVLIDLVVCIGPMELAVEFAHQRFPFTIPQLVRTQVQCELVLAEGALVVAFKSAAAFAELSAWLEPWLAECRRIPGLAEVADLAWGALNRSLIEKMAELLPRFDLGPFPLPFARSLSLSFSALQATALADPSGRPFLKITGTPVLA